MTTTELELQAKATRRKIVEMIYQAKSSHIGCALSATDILTALYFGDILKVDPKDPQKQNRDKFVLSKGHSVTALYATLAFKGFFPLETLGEYGKNGTALASHVVLGALPGLENTAGSGGHGLPIAVGMALAARKEQTGARVFILQGDGEMEEGSIWEAILAAGQYKLSNVVMVIDRNHLQDGVDGLRTEQILDLDPLDEKLRAFKWDVEVINGHNFTEILQALTKPATDKPRAIIANTIKGKGVSYMENRGEWHGKCPDESQYATALQELS